MAEKRIVDFDTLESAQDEDLLLIASESETYNIKYKTVKAGAEAAAAAAQEAAETAAANASAAARSAGSAAETARSAEDKAENAITKANAAMPTAGGTFTGDVKLKGQIAFEPAAEGKSVPYLEGRTDTDGVPQLNVMGTEGDEPVRIYGVSEPKQGADATPKSYVDRAAKQLGLASGTVGLVPTVKELNEDGSIKAWELGGGGGAKEWKLLQDVMVTADIDKQASGVTYIVGDNGVWAITFDKDTNGAAFAVGELHIFGILMGSANSSLAFLSSDPAENVAVTSYRNALGTAYAVYQIRITQVGGKWVTDHADKCTQYANQATPLAPTAMSNNVAFAGDMSKLTTIPNAVTLSKISITTSAAQIGMSGRLLIYGR